MFGGYEITSIRKCIVKCNSKCGCRCTLNSLTDKVIPLYPFILTITHISYFSEVSSSEIREFVEVCMVYDEDEEGVGVVEGVLGDELIIQAQQFSEAGPMPQSLEYRQKLGA